MTDRVSRIEADWKRLKVKGLSEGLGLSIRCRLITEFNYLSAQKALAPYGLVPYEWEVLAMLYRRGAPHRATASVIARETGRSSASITHRLDKLEERGLVKRSRTKEDARLVYATLTPKGKTLVQKAAAARMGAAGELVAGLSKSDLAQLNKLMAKLLLSLDPKGVDDI